jgi:hypothetical protein
MLNRRNVFDEEDWAKLLQRMEKHLGKKLTFEALLFLIGIQELGLGPKVFNKEEKQDLMHIAVCKLLSISGYYELEGLDSEGWPHWKQVSPLPFLSLKEQEAFLKMMMVEYFKELPELT